MMFAEQNQPVLERLRQLVGRREATYAGCDVQFALLPLRPGGWGLYVGRMTFTDSTARTERMLDYGAFKLLESFISVQDALKIIESAAVFGHLRTHGLDIAIEGHLQDDRSYWGDQRPGYWPSDGSAFGLRWPCNMFQLGQNPEPQLAHPGGPLVTQALPLYPDVSALLQHQIGHAVQGTVFTHNLVVLVPNYRARIIDVQVGMNSISVNTETHASYKEAPTVKVFARAGEIIQKETSLLADAQSYNVPLPARPDYWQIALLDHNGEFLDNRSPYMASMSSRKGLTVLDAEAICQLAAEGENEKVEFKLPPRDDRAREDLVETVVAFSNTEGGVILVGISDNG